MDKQHKTLTGPAWDYPRMCGRLQAILDVIHADIHVLEELYPGVWQHSPGSERLLMDIKEKVQRARDLDQNPITQ